MSALPLISILLAGAPIAAPPAQPAERTLTEKLQLADVPPERPACADTSRALDGDAGLRCAAPAADFARATWRTPLLDGLAGGRVAVLTAYQAPQRPELPAERTLTPFAGAQLRFDLVSLR